ncbi:MAG TPA: CBS domain-containing protein [Anaerolineales bacterium]|nr:CBS domain-containing protein [Anaerolineales bacterium]
MSSPVVIIPPDLRVSQALTLMRRRGIHSLVVDLTEGRPAYGILTTTDIRDKIVAVNRDPASVAVREILSTPVTFARADWTLVQASQAMQELKVHHLPVEDERGQLIGMISATDIFVAVEEAGWEPTGG